MQLKDIYSPISKELEDVEGRLERSLRGTAYGSILEMSDYLLRSGAKGLRPALALMSARAIDPSAAVNEQLINIAAAIELIHTASLIHDDIIDHSSLRHNKPTINSRWGEDASIVLGDYLYSIAFELISDSGNTDVIHCMSSAVKAMCEGELLQVCERDNLNLSKKRYFTIVKKKTASLFAASCQAGALMSKPYKSVIVAMESYGLNFGLAFQIVDDYLDFAGEEKTLGKKPGQDIRVGEMTLPVLDLLETLPEKEKKRFEDLLSAGKNNEALRRIRNKLVDSGSVLKTKETTMFFINSAKQKIHILPNSRYKDGLSNLADFVMERGFNDKN